MLEYKKYAELQIAENLFLKCINRQILKGEEFLNPEYENEFHELEFDFNEWNRFNLQLLKFSYFYGYKDAFEFYLKAGFNKKINRSYPNTIELIENKMAALDYIARNSSDNGIVSGMDRRDYTEEILLHQINRTVKEVYKEVLLVDFSNEEKSEKDNNYNRAYNFLKKLGLKPVISHPLRYLGSITDLKDALLLKLPFFRDHLLRPNYALVVYPSEMEKFNELKKEDNKERFFVSIGILLGKFSEYYEDNISRIGSFSLDTYIHKEFDLEKEHNHQFLNDNQTCEYCEEELRLFKELIYAGYDINICDFFNNAHLNNKG